MERPAISSKNGLKNSLEQRQLAKIEPLERPSLAGVDPKIARSLIRVYRKELKQRQQAEYIDAAKEVGLGSVAAVIYSGGQIAKGTLEGFFDVESSIAGNPDPIAQGVAITAQIVTIAWFIGTPLGRWLFKHLGLGEPASLPTSLKDVVKEGLKTVNALEGRDDVNGLYGVGITSGDYLTFVAFEWYSTPGFRDVALVFLALSNPLHAEKVDRRGDSVNGFTTPATAQVRNHPPSHLPWAIVWVIDQGVSIGQETIVGYWADQASAQTQADLYNKAYNRNAFVRQVT